MGLFDEFLQARTPLLARPEGNDVLGVPVAQRLHRPSDLLDDLGVAVGVRGEDLAVTVPTLGHSSLRVGCGASLNSERQADAADDQRPEVDVHRASQLPGLHVRIGLQPKLGYVDRFFPTEPGNGRVERDPRHLRHEADLVTPRNRAQGVGGESCVVICRVTEHTRRLAMRLGRGIDHRSIGILERRGLVSERHHRVPHVGRDRRRLVHRELHILVDTPFDLVDVVSGCYPAVDGTGHNDGRWDIGDGGWGAIIRFPQE